MNSDNSKIFIKSNENQWIFVSILIGISFASNALSSFSEPLKYLKYIPFFIGLFLLISRGSMLKLSMGNTPFIIPFFIIIASSFVRPFQYNSIFLNSQIFIISALIVFLSTYKISFQIKLINLFVFFALLIDISIKKGLNLDFSFSALIRSETSNLESNLTAFLFGLFFIYWLTKKNNIWAILNLSLIIISFKRIVVVAVIICLLSNVLSIKFKQTIFRPVFFIIVNILFVFFTYYISTDHFQQIVFEIFGLQSGHFTEGRSTFVSLVMPELFNKPMAFITGIGQDNLRLILSSKLGCDQYFHNDVFKILVEHGLIIFVIFFYFFYKINIKFILFPIFLNICMTTDNVLIYTPVLICYLILVYTLNKSLDTN